MLEPLFNCAAGLQGGGGSFKTATLSKRDSSTGVFCYQCQNFKNIIYLVGHETIYFEKYLRTAVSEDSSDAAILIFRRYLRGSSPLAFCKVSVLKTSVKFLGKHICWGLFSINLQTLCLKFYY